jgi:hypothetical protein
MFRQTSREIGNDDSTVGFGPFLLDDIVIEDLPRP